LVVEGEDRDKVAAVVVGVGMTGVLDEVGEVSEGGEQRGKRRVMSMTSWEER